MSRRSDSVPVEQLSEETRLLYDTLNNEGDLPAVLIAISFIDACLLSLLEAKLVAGSTREQLLSDGGPIGNFIARAKLAYVMRLIPKSWFSELTTLAELRNMTAHHRTGLNFRSPEVQALCAKLKINFHDEVLAARSRFVMSVVILANGLLVQALKVLHQEGKPYPEAPQLMFRGRRVDLNAPLDEE